MLKTNDRRFVEQLKQIIWAARSRAYSAINFAQVEANWLIGQRIVEEEQNGEARAEYGKYVIRLASQELTAEFGNGFSMTNIKNFKQFYLLFSNYSIAQTVSAQLTGQKQIGQAVPDQLTGKKRKGQTLSDQLQKGQTVSDQLQKGQTLSDQLQKGQTLSDQSFKHLILLSWSHYERLMRVESSEARDWYMHEAATEMWSVRTLDRNINTQYYNRILLSQMEEHLYRHCGLDPQSPEKRRVAA
ncbi:hypothetical protein SAMD00024442_48_4 [Candidatus Symbiothrix dinenymphae]|nr:hypothetical protein SAMD00024442_48_4 [Candidatus Symbiothrix dinenymphae]